MELVKIYDFDYFSFFYFRVFGFFWQFYGDNVGEVVYFGDYLGKSFGVYWVKEGYFVGLFFEGGIKEEYEVLVTIIRFMFLVEDLGDLEIRGLSFFFEISQKSLFLKFVDVGSFVLVELKLLDVWYVIVGVVLVVLIVVFVYWYGR